jgi:trk system potassium uptake protein TrkH
VANNIVLVYLVLSMLCFLAYWVSGMNLFEAVNHAMTTLSTGGYSTSDQSMSHFSNSAHWIGTLFMFLGGLPFLLYVQASPAVTTACSRMPRCRASSGWSSG